MEQITRRDNASHQPALRVYMYLCFGAREDQAGSGLTKYDTLHAQTGHALLQVFRLAAHHMLCPTRSMPRQDMLYSRSSVLLHITSFVRHAPCPDRTCTTPGLSSCCTSSALSDTLRARDRTCSTPGLPSCHAPCPDRTCSTPGLPSCCTSPALSPCVRHPPGRSGWIEEKHVSKLVWWAADIGGFQQTGTDPP
ncbi:hypothetical protein ACOMHN_006082 [Nucella lapillus]